MKKTKKKGIVILLLIVLLGSIIIPKSSIAAGRTVELYATHRYGNLLERNGVDLTCIYIVHKKDGIEYPSYCLNLELDGATEDFSYSVNADNLITDMEIWRTVTNGYPYKTPAELGCKTKEEAYLATRQAVYCAVYDRDPNSYKALGGEAGERTLKALKQIVTSARTSTEVKQSSTLTIKANNSMWTIDSSNENYVSKEFTVSAAAPIKDYKVSLNGNLVDGMKVTDTQNNEKTEFKNNEKFKILIPVKNIHKDGNFVINVAGQVATKPVYFGKSPDSRLQNTAITGEIYENGTGNKTEYYFENETKITILKKNQETKELLQGVKFQLLNKEKEVVYSDLTTDSNGTIVITNLLPGQYYVKEVETLEGYEVYDKLIKVDLKLNEEVKITVNNLHNEDIEKIEHTNTEIEVGQSKTEIEVEQNKTQINNEKNDIKIEQTDKDIKFENNNIEIKQDNTDIKVEQNDIEINQNKTDIKVEQNDIEINQNITDVKVEQNNVKVENEKTKTEIALPKTGM